jgi:hypothetical protein
MEKKTRQFIITDKKAYTGNSEHPPQGDYYIGNDKFTCWDPEQFAKFNINDEVIVEYTEKSNEYNGKTYTNRNISTMKYALAENNVSQIPQIQIREEISNEIIIGQINIQSGTYEVILKKI